MSKLIGVGNDGVETKIHFDANEFHVEKTQDIDAILKHNRDLKRETDGWSKTRDMKKVASIPNVVVADLMQQGIWNNPERFKKWLNDSDNEMFRTSIGVV